MLILLGRYVYMLVSLVPFFVYCYLSGELTGVNFWLPVGLLLIEEGPGLVFVMYLGFCKDREVQKFIN